MVNAGYLVADGGFDPEFFFQFAPHGVARLFAFFDLAAGKLPLQRHYLMACPLASQNLTLVNDKSSNYPFHHCSLDSGP